MKRVPWYVIVGAFILGCSLAGCAPLFRVAVLGDFRLPILPNSETAKRNAGLPAGIYRVPSSRGECGPRGRFLYTEWRTARDGGIDPFAVCRDTTTRAGR